MKHVSSLLLLAALSISPVACRAAFNPTAVPSDAQWVLYADCNALRTTPLGKELIAFAQKQQFQTTDAKIGVDVEKLLATVGTITAYGTNFSRDPQKIDGTMIVQGTPDLRKIAESLLLQATIASPEALGELNDLPFPAYTIRQKHQGQLDAVPLIVAFPPEQVLLIGKSRPQLLRARDAIVGKLPSVAKSSDAPLKDLLRASGTAYFFAASVVPPGALDGEVNQNEPQARILKMTNSGALAIGDNGPNTYAHAQLIATSDQMADKLMKIVQGLTAMLSLAETNDKQLAEFLSSANVARENRSVTLDLSYSSERLGQMVRMLTEKAATRTPEEMASAREAMMVFGEAVSQWQAVAAPAGQPVQAKFEPHAIENVALKTGTIISLGQEANGGRGGRFDRIDITPASGGAPLTFRAEFMRRGGPRGNLQQLQFPGTDGVYNLTVYYSNDPTGKTKYVVSVRAPKAPPAPVAPATPAEKKS